MSYFSLSFLCRRVSCVCRSSLFSLARRPLCVLWMDCVRELIWFRVFVCADLWQAKQKVSIIMTVIIVGNLLFRGLFLTWSAAMAVLVAWTNEWMKLMRRFSAPNKLCMRSCLCNSMSAIKCGLLHGQRYRTQHRRGNLNRTKITQIAQNRFHIDGNEKRNLKINNLWNFSCWSDEWNDSSALPSRRNICVCR